MKCIIYVRNNENIPIYEQYNICSQYAKRHGYSITGKVLDLDGKNLHNAINKIIPESEPMALIVYSREYAFDSFNDFLFFKIFIEKLGHKLIFCE